MSTNTLWLLTATSILLALGGIGALQAHLPATAFWTCVAALLSLLASWQCRARWYLNRQGISEWTAEEAQLIFSAIKPTAYYWLGAYFSLAFGFVAVCIASWYYQFTMSRGVIIPLFAAWWIKLDLWAFFLIRTRETLRIDHASHPLDSFDKL